MCSVGINKFDITQLKAAITCICIVMEFNWSDWCQQNSTVKVASFQAQYTTAIGNGIAATQPTTHLDHTHSSKPLIL